MSAPNVIPFLEPEHHPVRQSEHTNGFNYNELEPKVAAEARSAARRIKEHMKRSVIDIGCELVAIKALLDHGKFLDWVRLEFRIEPRTAQRYMAVAREFGSNCDRVSYLPPTTLFALTAKSTPPIARERLLARIDAGGRPGEKEVLDIIRTAKPAKLPKPAPGTVETVIGEECETETPKPYAGTNLNAERLAKRIVGLMGWEAKDIADFIAGSGDVLAVSIRRRLDEMAQEDQVARSSEIVHPSTLPNGLTLPAPAGDEADAESTEQRLITYHH